MTQVETLSDKLFGKARIPWCFAGWGFGWAFSEIMYIKTPVDFSAGHGPEAFLYYDAATIAVAVLIALAAFFFPDGLLPMSPFGTATSMTCTTGSLNRSKRASRGSPRCRKA